MKTQLRDVIRRAGTGAGPLPKWELVAGLMAMTAAVGFGAGIAGRNQPTQPDGTQTAGPEPVTAAVSGPASTHITVNVMPCHAQAAPTPAVMPPTTRKLDKTKAWTQFLLGGALVAIVAAGALVVFLTTPHADPWLTVRWAAFMLIPGFCMIGIGFYYRKQRQDGAIAYALGLKDYGVMFLQLLPGTLIAALGNVIANDPGIASWSSAFGWVSFFLGTAVSILVVRKFEKPAQP